METVDSIVLGGGISGLAAAWALRRAGRRPVVLEAGAAAGGMLRSVERGGYTIEEGPQTVQESPELARLCREAGLAGELVPATPHARRRYLLRRGRLAALPAGPQGILASGALSAGAKLRLLREPLVGPGPGDVEPVAAFFRRRLGDEVAATLADALVLGIYGGDPAELAIGAAFPLLRRLEVEHGSLFTGLRRGAVGPPPRLVGFHGGLGRLASRLAAGIEVRTGCRVRRVEAAAAGFAVEGAAGGERVALRTGRLVTALPAAESAELLAGLGETGSFGTIPHAPLAVVALGLRREAVEHPLDGFGFLAPHGEGRKVLGCLFSSSLFPGVAPPGRVLLTTMMGGRRRAELVELEDGELLEIVRGELGDLLGLAGEPELAHVARWRPGIPQPTAAVFAARRAAAALETAHAGLSVLGHWLRGVGVPDCARAGSVVEGRESESADR